MDRWDLPTIEATGKRETRVLFSDPACRAILIDLQAGEEMGEHRVREHAVLQVVSGRVAVTAGDRSAECAPGSLVRFRAGEAHSVRAVETARLLLVLAPWPGDGHFHETERGDPGRLQATIPPLDG